jgi:hypothetical protein
MGAKVLKKCRAYTNALFAWLISHQPAVLFSQNKPATSNRPAVLFSQNKPPPAISHRPTEQAASCSRIYRQCPLDLQSLSEVKEKTYKLATISEKLIKKLII